MARSISEEAMEVIADGRKLQAEYEAGGPPGSLSRAANTFRLARAAHLAG